RRGDGKHARLFRRTNRSTLTLIPPIPTAQDELAPVRWKAGGMIVAAVGACQAREGGPLSVVSGPLRMARTPLVSASFATPPLSAEFAPISHLFFIPMSPHGRSQAPKAALFAG